MQKPSRCLVELFTSRLSLPSRTDIPYRRGCRTSQPAAACRSGTRFRDTSGTAGGRMRRARSIGRRCCASRAVHGERFGDAGDLVVVGGSECLVPSDVFAPWPAVVVVDIIKPQVFRRLQKQRAFVVGGRRPFDLVSSDFPGESICEYVSLLVKQLRALDS